MSDPSHPALCAVYAANPSGVAVKEHWCPRCLGLNRDPIPMAEVIKGVREEFRRDWGDKYGRQ